ncbi:uncharacterized protein MONBRDRAFT_12462 [Monosiga brevicollis MX1]|uniref:Uncharacterized protein n=1 Tax=Monosiga brevicollis TaxID=81824 RepID=A9VCC4_MONBE|nr:uncharacterized protein MONBRDRAFT_12462 [Monosiga brevicollis MX1]EDQ84836.1 predicted protein [Monosiga brevicollis MX1]|eukprot:XP_001750337.1 hypothetical protein [Monosiga brevicollis MX1]
MAYRRVPPPSALAGRRPGPPPSFLTPPSSGTNRPPPPFLTPPAVSAGRETSVHSSSRPGPRPGSGPAAAGIEEYGGPARHPRPGHHPVPGGPPLPFTRPPGAPASDLPLPVQPLNLPPGMQPHNVPPSIAGVQPYNVPPSNLQPHNVPPSMQGPPSSAATGAAIPSPRLGRLSAGTPPGPGPSRPAPWASGASRGPPPGPPPLPMAGSSPLRNGPFPSSPVGGPPPTQPPPPHARPHLHGHPLNTLPPPPMRTASMHASLPPTPLSTPNNNGPSPRPPTRRPLRPPTNVPAGRPSSPLDPSLASLLDDAEAKVIGHLHRDGSMDTLTAAILQRVREHHADPLSRAVDSETMHYLHAYGEAVNEAALKTAIRPRLASFMSTLVEDAAPVDTFLAPQDRVLSTDTESATDVAPVRRRSGEDSAPPHVTPRIIDTLLHRRETASGPSSRRSSTSQPALDPGSDSQDGEPAAKRVRALATSERGPKVNPSPDVKQKNKDKNRGQNKADQLQHWIARLQAMEQQETA